MKILTQGIEITTNCKYIKFSESKSFRVIEDNQSSVLTIYFREGLRSCDVTDNHLRYVYKDKFHETDYIRVINPVVDICGLKFRKITTEIVNFSQYVVGDISDFLVEYSINHVRVLIPKKKIHEICTYIKCIKSIPIFEYISSDELVELTNITNLNIGVKNVHIDTGDKFEYFTKKFYEMYILRMIDVQERFIQLLTEKLESRGLQLLKMPIDENLRTASHVTYKISDLSHQESRKSGWSPLNEAVQHVTKFDFELSTPNLILFNDFRTRFQNLDFISNFTEFHTPDKFGNQWVSAVKWEPITTNFNSDFEQDSKGNFAYSAQFSCEVHHYVVYDVKHYKILQVILEQISEDFVGEIGSLSATQVIRGCVPY